MVDAAVSIIDRRIQLATVRKRNKEKYFKNCIEPLFRDGESIAQDYMTLLAELVHRIDVAQNCQEIIVWLEQRRAILQPLRIKVRTLVADGSMNSIAAARKTDLALFKKGLWGLMKGGISAVDDRHALTWEYGFSGHTVLDLLYRARIAALEDEFRDQLTHQAKRQQNAIEAAWQDVATAYARLKQRYLG